MNLKVPGAVLSLGWAILSTRAKTLRGVVATPLRRTRVKQFYFNEIKKARQLFISQKTPNESFDSSEP